LESLTFSEPCIRRRSMAVDPPSQFWCRSGVSWQSNSGNTKSLRSSAHSASCVLAETRLKTELLAGARTT
jgi:hypothetical protein